MKHKRNRLSAKCRQPFLKIISALFLIGAIGLTQVPVPVMNAAGNDFRMDGTSLIKYSGNDTNITIPDNVTSIGTEAFSDNTSLVTVKIPDNVTKIEKGAFSGCTELTEISIPNNVTAIGKSAFSGCTKLKNLSIGSGLNNLEAGAFGGCTSLKTATVSENNLSFECSDGVLYDKNQQKIYQMFAGRDRENFDMPSSVTSINEYAFWDCKNLKSVSISSNLNEISAYAFSNCSGLQKVMIPYSVKSIQMKAFENCAKLSDIDIPESVSFIHETAFDGCPLVQDKIKTTSITEDNKDNKSVSENSTDISVSLPQNVNEEEKQSDTIKSDTSEKMDTNTTENEKTETKPSIGNQQIDGMATPESKDVIGKTKIIGGQALVLINAQNADVISNGMSSHVIREDDTSPDGTNIVKESYYRNQDLTSYQIKQGVKEIEDFAFARSGLKKIVIPEGVLKIDYAAFYHCDNLSDIQIPETVTEIAAEAFDKTLWMEQWLSKNDDEGQFLIVGDQILLKYKGNEENVLVPDGVKQIAANAFRNHDELKSITFPDSLQKICNNAFDGCGNLKDFSGGSNVTNIETDAFYNCPIEASSITVTSKQENNSIGTIGNYHILKKKDLRNQGIQQIKYTGMIAFLLLAVTSFALSMRHKKADES